MATTKPVEAAIEIAEDEGKNLPETVAEGMNPVAAGAVTAGYVGVTVITAVGAGVAVAAAGASVGGYYALLDSWKAFTDPKCRPQFRRPGRK